MLSVYVNKTFTPQQCRGRVLRRGMEKVALKNRIAKLLRNAIEADEWGQSIEASGEYEDLDHFIKLELMSESYFADYERQTLNKIRAALKARLNALDPENDGLAISVRAMKDVAEFIEKDLYSRNASFPVDEIDFNNKNKNDREYDGPEEIVVDLCSP